MTIEEAISKVQVYQTWRQGADVPMIEPKELTEAINMLLLFSQLAVYLENDIDVREETIKEKAKQLYKDAYMRWCYELSHDANILIAKNICEYICDQFLNYVRRDKDLEFWNNVKSIIEKSSHNDLI